MLGHTNIYRYIFWCLIVFSYAQSFKIIIRFFCILFLEDSIPSLAAGLFFGSVLGYGAYQTSQDPTNVAVFLGTSTALGGLMGYRFYNSGKVMPAGVIAMLRYFNTFYITICAISILINVEIIFSAAMIVRTVMRYFSQPIKTQWMLTFKC